MKILTAVITFLFADSKILYQCVCVVLFIYLVIASTAAISAFREHIAIQENIFECLNSQVNAAMAGEHHEDCMDAVLKETEKSWLVIFAEEFMHTKAENI